MKNTIKIILAVIFSFGSLNISFSQWNAVYDNVEAFKISQIDMNYFPPVVGVVTNNK